MMVAAEPILNAEQTISKINKYGFISIGLFNTIIIKYINDNKVMYIACKTGPKILEFLWQNEEYHKKIYKYIIKYKNILKLDMSNQFIMSVLLSNKYD